MAVSDSPEPVSQAGPQPKPLAKLSVLMPVYNERWTLPQIVRRVLDAPIPLELELVAVDDCSSDGSAEWLEQFSAEDARVRVVRHARNQGKGAAIRTAIQHMTGDVAVIQDADLEYDPSDFPALLEPILAGKADAVFGTRFRGHPRRVLKLWHTLMNQSLTFVTNVLNDLTLSDMETCYKMVRADVLKRLRLTSHTFTLEPELTCRLAQWGARIYEVPVSYCGRSFQEGKKIRPIDGLKALATLVRCRFFDPQFTDHKGLYKLRAQATAGRYNHWLFGLVEPFLGKRVLQPGAGIGGLSTHLLNRERLLMTDHDPLYISQLEQRLGSRDNVRIDRCDRDGSRDCRSYRAEQLDTVLCASVLEFVEDDADALASYADLLTDGGHCIAVVPAGEELYCSLDVELGHRRRYSEQELHEKMKAAGLDVVHSQRVGRAGTLGWGFVGHVLRRKQLSPRLMKWLDRCLPLTKLLERMLPVPGLSLIVVGRKPLAASIRRAA